MMNRSIVAAVAIAVLASSFSVSPGFARTGGANGAAGAAAAGPGGNGGPARAFFYTEPPPRIYLPRIAIDSKKRCGQAFEARAAYDYDDQATLYCKQ